MASCSPAECLTVASTLSDTNISNTFFSDSGCKKRAYIYVPLSVNIHTCWHIIYHGCNPWLQISIVNSKYHSPAIMKRITQWKRYDQYVIKIILPPNKTHLLASDNNHKQCIVNVYVKLNIFSNSTSVRAYCKHWWFCVLIKKRPLWVN